MSNVFAVVGEDRDDPDRLLILGEDGQFYRYVFTDGVVTPVQPDDGRVIEPNAPPVEKVAA
jgi:hypothetical protein